MSDLFLGLRSDTTSARFISYDLLVIQVGWPLCTLICISSCGTHGTRMFSVRRILAGYHYDLIVVMVKNTIRYTLLPGSQSNATAESPAVNVLRFIVLVNDSDSHQPGLGWRPSNPCSKVNSLAIMAYVETILDTYTNLYGNYHQNSDSRPVESTLKAYLALDVDPWFVRERVSDLDDVI